MLRCASDPFELLVFTSLARYDIKQFPAHKEAISNQEFVANISRGVYVYDGKKLHLFMTMIMMIKITAFF